VVGWLLTALLLPEVLEQIQVLSNLIPQLPARLHALTSQIPQLRSLELQLMGGATLDRLQPLGGQLLGFAGGAANSTVQLLLIALLAVLLALDPRSHQKLLLAATPLFYRARMQQLLSECREALGGWLAGMTLSAVVVFLASWAGLALLKVPLALLSALVCALLTFVPTIGPTAATLLPMAVALLLVSPAKMLQVAVLRLVLQNAEAFVLTGLAEPHGKPLAHRGSDGPTLPRSVTGAAGAAAGPSPGGGAAGDLPGGLGARCHGQLDKIGQYRSAITAQQRRRKQQHHHRQQVGAHSFAQTGEREMVE